MTMPACRIAPNIIWATSIIDSEYLHPHQQCRKSDRRHKFFVVFSRQKILGIDFDIKLACVCA